MLRTIRALVLLPCLFLTQGQLISQSRSTVLYNTNSGKIAAPILFFFTNIVAGTNLTIYTNGDGTITLSGTFLATAKIANSNGIGTNTTIYNLTIPSNSIVTFGSNDIGEAEMFLYRIGTNQLAFTNGQPLRLKWYGSSSANCEIGWIGGNFNFINSGLHDFRFGANAIARWKIDGSGATYAWAPATDNLYSLGTATLRPTHLYLSQTQFNQGSVQSAQFVTTNGMFYRTNIAANLPTGAQIGVGGFWIGNSNGVGVALRSTDGSTTIMTILTP